MASPAFAGSDSSTKDVAAAPSAATWVNPPPPICRSTTYPERSGAANLMSFQTTVIERPPLEALTPVTVGAGMAMETVPERVAWSWRRTALSSVVWALARNEYVPLQPKLKSPAKVVGVRPVLERGEGIAHPDGASPLGVTRMLIARELSLVKYAVTCTTPTSVDDGVVSDDPFHADEPES